MATLTVSSDMDAAEALLELQQDHRRTKFEQSRAKEFRDNSLPMAAFLYNFIGSRPNSPLSNKNYRIDELKTHEEQNITHSSCNNNIKCKLPKQEAIITKVWSDSHNDRTIKINKVAIITHDKATQTEIEYQMPELEKMENVIRSLCSKIETLENRLKNKKSETSSLIDSVTDQNTDISNDERSMQTFTNLGGRRSHKRKRTSTINTDLIEYYNSTSANTTYADLSNDETETDKDYSNSSKILKTTQSYKGKSDMVSIGEGNAVVPSKLLKSMDWSSYTNATRKLLTAVFSRKVLATHSLTGKPSPAFPDKPAKKKLDSSLVNDIVQTVVEKCHVPESVVRTSITTKCADESKMFRSRQQNKKKRNTTKRNRENVPPINYESDDSSESYLSS